MKKHRLNILAIHANTGARFYRVIPQLKWMQKQGHKVRLERYDAKYLMQIANWADVIIFQSVFDIELAQILRRMGKTVLFEIDDLMHKVSPKHYSYKETHGWKNQIRWWWRIFRMLRAVDALIVSTDELKRVYGWLARKVLVFNNYLDLPHWLKEKKKNPSDRIRLLWAGSTSHTGDLEWVKPIIHRILDKYPQVQFIYVGTGGVPTDDLYARFIYGEDIFEGLPKDRRESMLAAPAAVWPYILASLGADIAIAPLEKNYFNKFKSQCKYLEYAVNGIPAVYSKWFYTEVRDVLHPLVGDEAREAGVYQAPTGIAADSPQEWISALSLLIENATLRNSIGENARLVAIDQYDFRNHAHRWQEFVEQLAWHNQPIPSSHSAIKPEEHPV